MIGLLVVIEIPLVHWSVRLWRSLHQEASVLDTNGDVDMDGLMLFSLFIGVMAFTLLYVWLLLHRTRRDGDGRPARRSRSRPGGRRSPGGGSRDRRRGGAVVAIEDAGFILGSYAVTSAVIAGLAWRVLRSGRRLADRVDDHDKYWT